MPCDFFQRVCQFSKEKTVGKEKKKYEKGGEMEEGNGLMHDSGTVLLLNASEIYPKKQKMHP